jgi:hypothetical protein
LSEIDKRVRKVALKVAVMRFLAEEGMRHHRHIAARQILQAFDVDAQFRDDGSVGLDHAQMKKICDKLKASEALTGFFNELSPKVKSMLLPVL